MMLASIERRLEQKQEDRAQALLGTHKQKKQPGPITGQGDVDALTFTKAMNKDRALWKGPVTALRMSSEIRNRIAMVRLKHGLTSLRATVQFLILRGLEVEEQGQ